MEYQFDVFSHTENQQVVVDAFSQLIKPTELPSPLMIANYLPIVMSQPFIGTSFDYGASALGWASPDYKGRMDKFIQRFRQYVPPTQKATFQCEGFGYAGIQAGNREYDVFYERGYCHHENDLRAHESYLKASLVVNHQFAQQIAAFFAQHVVSKIEKTGKGYGMVLVVCSSQSNLRAKVMSDLRDIGDNW